MKQRFRARELWLFAPFLLFGVAALLYWRWEQVTPPDKRGMYVSDFQVKAASGYWQEKGYSHQVKVVVSHPWPPPKWWGGHLYYRHIEGALHPETARLSSPVNDQRQALATGESFTIVRAGKSVELPAEYLSKHPGFDFDGTNYITVNYLNLSSLPQSSGAVTLHGLYRIAGEPQLRLKRQILKAGETLKVTPDKNPRAQLVSATPKSFYILNSGNTRYDSCNISFIVRYLDLPAGQESDFQIYNVELHDANGKLYRDDGAGIFVATQFFTDDLAGRPLRRDEEAKGLSVSINRMFALTGDLTVTGEISADNRWPLKFEAKLPPRPATSAAKK